jgi:hypothetical protein
MGLEIDKVYNVKVGGSLRLTRENHSFKYDGIDEIEGLEFIKYRLCMGNNESEIKTRRGVDTIFLEGDDFDILDSSPKRISLKYIGFRERPKNRWSSWKQKKR